MNENKDKISEKSKAQSPIKSNKPVSNPLSKQLNALKKPALKTPDKIATKKKLREFPILFLLKHLILSLVSITLIRIKLQTECMEIHF